MMTLNAYLHFQGNCEEAFKVYEKILGGRIGMTTRFSDAPTGHEQRSRRIARTRSCISV